MFRIITSSLLSRLLRAAAAWHCTGLHNGWPAEANFYGPYKAALCVGLAELAFLAAQGVPEEDVVVSFLPERKVFTKILW